MMTATATVLSHDELYESVRAIDFNCPFTLSETQGAAEMSGMWGPESLHISDDGELLDVPSDWDVVTGYGSFGGIFHPSQFVGGAMARELAQEFAGYVLVFVVVEAFDDECEDAAGWALMSREI